MDLDIDLYFWHLDKCGIEDNADNKVQIEEAKVSIGAEHKAKLENGYYFGKMMHAIQKNLHEKGGSLPVAALDSLKDVPGAVGNNWNLITDNMAYFNIDSLTNE